MARRLRCQPLTPKRIPISGLIVAVLLVPFISGCENDSPSAPPTPGLPGQATEGGAPSTVSSPWLPSTATTLGSYRLVIEPGEGAEVDFVMPKGARVEAKYRATGKLLIEAHAHFEGRVETFGQRFAAKATGRIEARSPGVYSFLWAHAAAPTESIEIIVTLRGDATIDQWITGTYDGTATLAEQQASKSVEAVTE